MRRKIIPNFGNVSSRILSLLLALIMVLGMVPGVALADTGSETGTTVYLKPNSNWTQANARFAAYFFNDSTVTPKIETWVSMTDGDGDGYYECVVPTGGYNEVIFCRMNPGATDNKWDNKWNQTNDLTLSDSNICYTVADGAWSNGDGSWTSYVYTVAGVSALCGSDWTPDDASNAMTDNGDGTWSKTYSNVAAGTYELKVTQGTWEKENWGNNGNNYSFETGATSNVKITFNANTKAISVEVTYSVTFNGSNVTSNGAETATAGSDYTATLTAAEGYTLPETVTVTVGGSALAVDNYTYDSTTGVLTIPAALVTGDIVITAEGVEIPNYLYLKPSSGWLSDNARFAAYFFNSSGNTWVNMTDSDGDGYYEVDAPDGYPSVIFCRMNPGVSENSFDNSRWNQTGDLTVPTNDNNCYTVPENDQGNQNSLTDSYWSVYAPGSGGNPAPTPTPTEDYYLYGWFNGADVTGNDYKFEDGKLTITFTATDNYIFVKDSSGASYMTNGWLGFDATSATLGTSYSSGDKLYVPAGEHTFTLADNGDGTLALSYETKTEPQPTPVDYYLVGYINGADLGIANDSANLGNYKFEDGKLTVTFTSDSYVVVKNNNGIQYWSETYCTDTTATLKTGANEKMFVPANTELTFTLVENGDGTLTLSYTVEVDIPTIPDGYNTVTIHFLKPSTWGSTINAWVWDDSGALPGYELYNTAWPGSPIPANTDKAGWYDLAIGTANPQAFNFIFNDGSSQTADLPTGAITGPTELWVVDGTVYTTAPLEWTHYTAIIHFQKPDGWGDTVSAYAWTPAEGTSAEERLLGAWPGTVTSASVNSGWYTTTIRVEIGKTLNYIFNNNNNGKQTADLTAGVLTGNVELWIDGSGNSVSKPSGWVDETRTIHLPGTLPGPSWDASSNQMTYDPALGLYVITFEDVPAGTYEYKIAVNGSWNENYGYGGAANGNDISVVVPSTQDVTFWYSDMSHRVVCSVDYDINAAVTLTGTGIPEGTKLTDPELDGLYTVTVNLPAGTYSGLKIDYGTTEVSFNEFTLENEKSVTFFFDPSTGLAYHNGSDDKVDTTYIRYDSRDLTFKDPFGAVAVGEEVIFSIITGLDATGVALVIKGLPAVEMSYVVVEDTVKVWTCTTTFASIGEYQYYFAITNGSDMVFYCDDNYNNYYKKGDYGTGTVRDINNIFPYDLVVYEAGYETPDWMKDAVIYQIFPDRFFDAQEYNNDDQTWARGEVDYEYVSDWYLLPENPEAAATDGDSYPTYAFKGDGEWSNEIYGGDLKGIVEKIDYLKALGVNVIYLNPVFWSISNHRYDAVSYTEIDPILGTLGDFEELVKVAEENDMHIILDGVFNHVSDDSVYFDRYYKFLPDAAEKYDGKIGAYPYWAYVYDYMAENGVDQAAAETAAKTYFSENYGITDYSYTEWFAVSNVTGTAVDNIGLRAGKNVYSYEGWWGYDSMPVIKSTNGSEYQTGNWAEEIIDGQNSVNAYWISKGMDGWRLDVANEVSDETWQNFRDSVKALDSEAVIIGEIWSDSTHYLMGDMYDSVMNYVFRDAVAGFARGYLINRDNKAEKYDSDLTADEAMTILEILRERYPEEAFYAMMNLVASHDTSRILSYLDDVEDDRYQKDIEHAFPTYENTSDHAKQLQYVVAFIQFTYAGAPTIYYGDEIGMVGGDDPDDRRAFTWGKGNQDIVEWYAELAAIRAAYPALRTGSVEPFSTGNDDVMGYVRCDDANTIVILVNRDSVAQTYELNGTWVDLVSGKTYTGTIPAYRGVILVAENEVKAITVDTENLAPAYDPAYIVAERNTTPPENPSEEDDTPPAPVGPTLYTITKAACENGKVTAQAIMASKGSTIKVSAVPAEGYKVWTLTVTDAAGNEIEIVDGKIKMPASNITVSATFVYDLPFEDVADDAENYAAIAYMYENGLMVGTSTEQYIFDGDVKMTRSQIAQILYRLAGEPTVEYSGAFTDVAEGKWYTAAVEWAASKGIMVGVGDGTFAHNRQITVVEMSALIYRYAQCQLTGECTSSGWATESAAAMTWCVENGVLAEGTDGTTIADRNLAAEMFYNVYNLLNK